MRNIDKKKLSYIAGGLFAAELLYSVVSHLIGGGLYWTSVLYWVSQSLLVAAMLSGKYKLFAIGIALRLPELVVSVFSCLQSVFHTSNWWVMLLIYLFGIGAYILLIMAVRNPQNAKKLGTSAAGLLLAGHVVSILNVFVVIGNLDGQMFYLLMSIVLYYMPIALAGYVMQPVEQDILEFINTDPVKEIANLETKLNTNAITQEEFEEKKNELLGL